MSREDNWKLRLAHMEDAARNILDYCHNIKDSSEFGRDRKTFDACIRNFQILGEAAKKVPTAIQKEHPVVPWKNIKGLRDVVVHEYFGTSPKIVWTTIERDIPPLLKSLTELNKTLRETSHPWRICAAGETYVRQATIHAHLQSGHNVREHLRKDHCRVNAGSSKDILTSQEVRDISDLSFANLTGGPSPQNLGFPEGNNYDVLIRGWVRYWNDVFKPQPPLPTNVVKALIASESSFKTNANSKNRGAAKGLMQLLPATLTYLRGEKGELKDHILDFSAAEAFEPAINIAGGIRWLFRKRDLATARLKRPATWDEAVAEYKDYLRRKSDPQIGMTKFRDFLKILEEQK